MKTKQRNALLLEQISCPVACPLPFCAIGDGRVGTTSVNRHDYRRHS